MFVRQSKLRVWGESLNEDTPEPLLLLHRIEERYAEAGDPARALKDGLCNW